jgi:tRNA-guanine family transglycosylase
VSSKPAAVAFEDTTVSGGGMKPGFSFALEATDAAGGRAGRLVTPRGEAATPVFMPVGTLATVKGVDVGRLAETGASIVLGNTYHLHLRPGEAVVEAAGGIAAFMGWSGPTLTDSGGFQIFSLAEQVKITDEGAAFRSHIDGAAVCLTPEASMQIQQSLGADIAMQLDDVVGLPGDRSPGQSGASPATAGPTRPCLGSCREASIRICDEPVPRRSPLCRLTVSPWGGSP